MKFDIVSGSPASASCQCPPNPRIQRHGNVPTPQNENVRERELAAGKVH